MQVSIRSPAPNASGSATRNRLDQALAQWRLALGTARVINRAQAEKTYGPNEIAADRRIAAALRPRTAGEVVDIVRIAARHRIPLYPISTGFNWGYGAALPARNDCVIVDLSRMNRILDLDADLGLVTVEPGVTQQQLYDHLREHRLPFLVPVTGAGPYCSLLGNALERGYGVTPHTDHFGAVTSLEAVLPDGSDYRSAHAHQGCKLIDKAFKWGIGPYLDGLFTQGNFGIVTRVTIALAPIPEHVEGFLAPIHNEADLEQAVEAIRSILRSIGGITGSINLMNARRMLAMSAAYPRDQVPNGSTIPDDLLHDMLQGTRFGAWNVGGMIHGDKHLVKIAKKRIRQALKPVSQRVMFFDRTKIDVLQRIFRDLPGTWAGLTTKQLDDLSEAFKVAEGAPTQAALPLCYWKSGTRPARGEKMDPAEDGCGLIWYSPLVPMKPDCVRDYIAMVEHICTEHGMEPLITLTSLSDRCFDSTVPLLFDRNDPEDTARSQACYRALYEAGKQRGFLPYRVGIDHMDLAVTPGTSFWDLVAQLKDTVDPNRIIAPGRYCPDPSAR